MNYDPQTFGKSPAAEVLADKVSRADKSLQKKVGRFLGHYFVGLRHLENLPEPRTRARLLELWYQDHIAKIPDAPGIDSYIANVIKAAHAEVVRKVTVPAHERRKQN